MFTYFRQVLLCFFIFVRRKPALSKCSLCDTGCMCSFYLYEYLGRFVLNAANRLTPYDSVELFAGHCQSHERGKNWHVFVFQFIVFVFTLVANACHFMKPWIRAWQRHIHHPHVVFEFVFGILQCNFHGIHRRHLSQSSHGTRGVLAKRVSLNENTTYQSLLLLECRFLFS